MIQEPTLDSKIICPTHFVKSLFAKLLFLVLAHLANVGLMNVRIVELIGIVSLHQETCYCYIDDGLLACRSSEKFFTSVGNYQDSSTFFSGQWGLTNDSTPYL